MRFLITSDWHTDWYTAGVRRFEDVRNAALQTAQIARAKNCDAYLFLGDLADPEAEAFWACRLVNEVRASLSIPSWWLVGNHDVVEDPYGTHTLLPINSDRVIDKPTCTQIWERYWLIGLPYTSTARSYDPSAFLQYCYEKIPEDSEVVVISHLMIEGIAPGSETTDMARGRDIFLPIDLIRQRWPNALVCNGHYHNAQEYNGVHIPGALIRLTKGELANNPGFLIANL